MLKKLLHQPQLRMFKTILVNFINPPHGLCLLAMKFDWESLEKEFAPLYGEVGRPSIPIRTIDLSGTAGDKINTLLAAAAYNMKKWMRLRKEELLKFILRWISQSQFLSLGNIQLSLR